VEAEQTKQAVKHLYLLPIVPELLLDVSLLLAVEGAVLEQAKPLLVVALVAAVEVKAGQVVLLSFRGLERLGKETLVVAIMRNQALAHAVAGVEQELLV